MMSQQSCDLLEIGRQANLHGQRRIRIWRIYIRQSHSISGLKGTSPRILHLETLPYNYLFLHYKLSPVEYKTKFKEASFILDLNMVRRRLRRFNPKYVGYCLLNTFRSSPLLPIVRGSLTLFYQGLVSQLLVNFFTLLF